MNLLEIRKEFIRKSGRYDLVGEDFSDDGANFFIQAGQRYLDHLGDFQTGQIASLVTGLGEGENEIWLPNCWKVINVYAQGDECQEWQSLTFVHSISALTCRFGNGLYYTFIPVREQLGFGGDTCEAQNTPASALTYPADMKMEDFKGLRLLICPTVTRPTSFRIIGNFSSTELKNDSDKNWWSERYPETLLKASMYQLEVFYRNTEGAKDWLEAVHTDIQNIENSQLLATIQNWNEIDG